jgi:hypothetical protein
VAPAPDWVGAKVADPEEPVVPNAGLAGWITWACASPSAASHIIITKMNIRFIGSPRLANRIRREKRAIMQYKTRLDRPRSRLSGARGRGALQNFSISVVGYFSDMPGRADDVCSRE